MGFREGLMLAGAVLAGCATAPKPQETAPADSRMAMMEMMEMMCPVKVAGTSVRAEDTPTGAALVFTTTGDVAELRSRVKMMAQKHARMHGEGKGEGHMQAPLSPPPDVEAVEVEAGAQLLLTPRETAQLPALRAMAQARAQAMAGGDCPMMRGP